LHGIGVKGRKYRKNTIFDSRKPGADCMKNIRTSSLEDFYKEAAGFTGKEVEALLPPGINREIGHFNIFDIAETIEEVKRKSVMPYNRRAYYKISLIRGRSRAEYADRV